MFEQLAQLLQLRNVLERLQVEGRTQASGARGVGLEAEPMCLGATGGG